MEEGRGAEVAEAELLFALQNGVDVFVQAVICPCTKHVNSLVVFPSVFAALAHEEPSHWLIRRAGLEHNAIRDVVAALRALLADFLSVRHLRLVRQRLRGLLLSLQLLHNLSVQQVLVRARSAEESGLSGLVDEEYIPAIRTEQH